MKKNWLCDKKILLGVTGSIAAYKACEVVRLLKKRGADVRVMMTESATRFVGPVTFQTLSRNRVLVDLFDNSGTWVPQHISVAQWADVLLVAPATANVINKARAGIADDLLSSVILSVTCPVIFAPAMNERMYEKAVVQESIEVLRKRGCSFVGPEEGFLAEGYERKGRLADVTAIVDHVSALCEVGSLDAS